MLMLSCAHRHTQVHLQSRPSTRAQCEFDRAIARNCERPICSRKGVVEFMLASARMPLVEMRGGGPTGAHNT